jgi:hypothetical protein
MKQFKVTATMEIDLYLIVAAESAEDAMEIARDMPEEFHEENDGMSGDFRIDDAYEYEDEDNE